MHRTSILIVCATLSSALAFAQGPWPSIYTTLSGFYDYQSNGGMSQYIAVNPANGHIHVIYMSSFDSTDINASRRTYYAYSTNGGSVWNSFSNLTVPHRWSGFPSLDLLRTAGGYCPAIANHSATGAGTCGSVFVDCPEGEGAFSEILVSSTNVCLQWPRIACTADSGIVFVGSGTVEGINGTYVKRLNAPQTWTRLTADITSCYAIAASAANRVGVLLNRLGNGVFLFESTDNGRTWPAPRMIYPPQRIVGPDTFQAYVGCDLTYLGADPIVALHEFMTNAEAPTDSSRILFWSQYTGPVVAADKFHTYRVVPTLNKPQVNQKTMGYPAIGVVQDRIVIIYQASMPETSMAGFNFSDLMLVKSTSGLSWSYPGPVTGTPALDERYPCISKTNWPSPPNFIYVVWQEDSQPGSAAYGDNAPLSRASQKFSLIEIVPIGGVDQHQPLPGHFALEQNYPNPFNPKTEVGFWIGELGLVSLRVYDVLGREVATLVNERLEPGRHTATWDAGIMGSGVYFCQLHAGPYRAVRKLVLLK